jgi:hypothetical protein
VAESAAAALGDRPRDAEIPTLDGAERGTVVWHREHLRIADQPAVAAAADADVLLPVFVFDPSFYAADGLACDARIDFLHDCLADLDAQYRAVADADAGLTLAHGDPIEVLGRFRDAGWDVVAAATPSGRYGRRRDRRARTECDVSFVDGDGLVRGVDRPRDGWQERVEAWLTDDHATWDPDAVSIREVATDITIDDVDDAYGIEPTKSKLPTGGTTAARRRLAERTPVGVGRRPRLDPRTSRAVVRVPDALRHGARGFMDIYIFLYNIFRKYPRRERRQRFSNSVREHEQNIYFWRERRPQTVPRCRRLHPGSDSLPPANPPDGQPRERESGPVDAPPDVAVEQERLVRRCDRDPDGDRKCPDERGPCRYRRARGHPSNRDSRSSISPSLPTYTGVRAWRSSASASSNDRRPFEEAPPAASTM